MAAYDFEGHITDIPDYPEKGVVFKDITTLLKEPEGFHAAIDAIADHFKDAGVTKVVGAEARGFLIGAPVAYRLGAGFVPARKPGKLPAETLSYSYDLEYGSDTIEIHSGMSLIATVGQGMSDRTGTAARLFTALAKSGVNIRMIDQGSSEINIIVGVESSDYERAINAIYEEFFN